MRSLGLCTRCGKSAAPYSLCDSHRAYINVSRSLRKFLKLGIVKKENNKYIFLLNYKSIPRFHNIKPNDRRKLSRINNKPIDEDILSNMLIEILQKENQPLSEAKILERYGTLKMKLETNIN